MLSAGAYLYICVNWFHVHYDEAFSSLHIPHFKGFTRIHISKQVGSYQTLSPEPLCCHTAPGALDFFSSK